MRTHDHAHDLDRVRPADPDLDVPAGKRTLTAGLAVERPVLPSGLVQRKAERDGNGVAADASTHVDAAAATTGAPLPDELRERFEASLGADLSGVRVHTDSTSATAAHAVGAKAYTVGQDIHFGAGQFDPSSAGGQHLLAHEVAHTVQQAGAGTTGAQFKLEVSTPGDAAELEADRAADAMVAGAAATVSAAPSALRRYGDQESWPEELAKQGERDAVEAQKQQLAPALAVSNVRDLASAQALLNTLQANETLLQQGVSQGEVDASALKTNGAVIADLQLYVGAATQQSVSTSNFQQHYATLLRDFGRLENMFQKYAGGSVKAIQNPSDANREVQNQANAGGSTTDELRGAFEKLRNDPVVKVQIDAVQTTVGSLSGLPQKVQTASSQASTAMGKVNAGIMKLRSATNREVSAQLKQQFAAAAKKAAAAEGLAGKIVGALSGGAQKGWDTATKTSTATGGYGIQYEKAAAGFGSEAVMAALGTGGMALAGVAVDTMWKVLKPMVDQLMTQMDISVGAFPDKRDEAAGAKDDSSTYEAARAAAEELRLEKQSMRDAFTTYFEASKELEKKKEELKRKLDLLGETLQQLAKQKGMGGAGQQLAEMTAFVAEGQAFVVQAQTVERIGSQELDAKKKEQAPAVARERMSEFNKGSGREVMLAYKWYGKKAGGAPGEQAEHIGVNPTHVSIDSATNGKALDTTPEERRGQGSADASAQGDLGANGVIGEAVTNVRDMMAKADAYVKSVNEQIFGNALSPAAG